METEEEFELRQQKIAQILQDNRDRIRIESAKAYERMKKENPAEYDRIFGKTTSAHPNT